MTPQHPLVEHAQAALARLAEVPRLGEASRGSADKLERAWVRAPLAVAIGGAVPARTELFNYLCGRKVFDPDERQIGCAGLRIRRGKQTRFKARRNDGTTEEHLLPPEHADDDATRMRTQSATAEVQERKLALERVEHALPRFVRKRPRGIWMFLWPIWWLLTRRYRRALADRRFTEMAYDEACEALAVTKRELEEAEGRIRVQRGRFFESLRALSSGSPLGSGVREVELELGDGPLPPGVELIELTRPAQATESVDAIFLVERDVIHAPHNADGNALKVGKVPDVIANLPVLLGRARTLTLATAARDALEPVVTKLDHDVTDSEESFRLSIDRLEAMQIGDKLEFVQKQLASVRPQISQSIHAVIEHAAHHLGSELAALGNEWAATIANARTNDELKAAVQRIEQSAPLDAKRIAQEIHMLAVGGAAGSAHDLFPELLASLKPHGLEEPPPRTAPQLPPIDLMPTMTHTPPGKLSGAGGWLSGLFRSFETRRTDVATKATARVTQLRELASSELLNAEPKLFAAIEATLQAQLLAAIARQEAWLEKTLANQRNFVAREGAKLAPLARMRDSLRDDLDKLAAGIEQLENENIGLAAAAAAVTSIA